MLITFCGKLIRSKLLNDTLNEVNVRMRKNDQSHLIQTEEIMPAKMQQSQVITILIICLIYNN